MHITSIMSKSYFVTLVLSVFLDFRPYFCQTEGQESFFDQEARTRSKRTLFTDLSGRSSSTGQQAAKTRRYTYRKGAIGYWDALLNSKTLFNICVACLLWLTTISNELINTIKRFQENNNVCIVHHIRDGVNVSQIWSIWEGLFDVLSSIFLS